MSQAKYYLRDEKTNKKVQLEVLDERLTVQVREDDPLEIKKTLAQIEKMAPDISLRSISSNVYEIKSPNPISPSIIKERLKTEMKNVIPYNVHRVKGRVGDIYITNEILVTFFSGVSATEIKLLAEKHNLNKLEEFQSEQIICVFAQKPGNWENPIDVANKLENEKWVEIAEPSLVNRLVTTETTLARPTDNFFQKQWQLETNGRDEVSENADINAREAWNLLNGGGDPNIVIAVVDFGFDLEHPDLVNKVLNINLDPFDFVNRSPKFPKPLDPDEDHGTKCAGIAVAEKNGSGVVGIAYGCSLLPVCCRFNPTNVQLVAVLHAIRNKADVISCSFAPEVGTVAMSPTRFRMIERIARSEGRQGQGCVICFAAGNGNLPLNEEVTNYTYFVDGVKQDPITGAIINPFASHADVIAVAASTAKNKKALYSNWGKEVWVCAPSNDMEDDGTTIEPSITTTSSTGNLDSRRYTDEFGGTSSSAPLVAGVAALVISANPGLSAAQVKEILKETADKINPDNNDPEGKYDNDGHSKWYGYGKVNAGNAVSQALTMRA